VVTEGFSAGDIVSCLLDLDTGTLQFGRNGRQLAGVVFSGLKPGVAPAVMFDYVGETVRIKRRTELFAISTLLEPVPLPCAVTSTVHRLLAMLAAAFDIPDRVDLAGLRGVLSAVLAHARDQLNAVNAALDSGLTFCAAKAALQEVLLLHANAEGLLKSAAALLVRCVDCVSAAGVDNLDAEKHEKEELRMWLATEVLASN
jgi:hypothetical protein